jgi:CubicO group peptidase (beta-lactamase class C family)
MSRVDPERLRVLLDLVGAEVESGALPSAQVAVALDGELVAARSYGKATDTTRYVLQSCGRTVVATVVWKLISDGLLDIRRTVSSYVPEFAANGKEAVTVEQVLTHTAGFPTAPLKFPAMADRSERVAAFARWRLTYPPGTRLEFHLTSAAWVLEEICFRVTGSSMRDYLREAITGPLNLGSIEIGPPVEATDIAEFVRCGPDDDGELNPWGPWFLAPREVLAAGEPSHSVVGTAADVALLHQGILHSELWQREVVADALRVRVTLPVEGERGGTRSVPGNVALFVVVAGDDGLSRAFLPTTGTPGLFGHGGAPCQVAFADPGTGLSFAFLTNGYPASGYETSRHGRNRVALVGGLAADLI